MSKKKAIAPQPEPAKVFCSDCLHFVRDTQGISHNIETGEYFMGICNKGLTPDGCRKAFANKPRICSEYKENNTINYVQEKFDEMARVPKEFLNQ